MKFEKPELAQRTKIWQSMMPELSEKTADVLHLPLTSVVARLKISPANVILRNGPAEIMGFIFCFHACFSQKSLFVSDLFLIFAVRNISRLCEIIVESFKTIAYGNIVKTI